MKKRIGNSVYNTESAKKTAESSGETLYRKQTGEFFIYNGNDILPCSATEAGKWLINNSKQSEYDALFGEVKNSRRTKLIGISEETFNLLNRLVQDTGRTKTDIIDELVAIYAGRDYSPKKHDE